MDRARFEELVVDALHSLPPEIARRIENVEVVVEDEPPSEVLAGFAPGTYVFGLYHGIPLTKRGTYGNALPDKISIYRLPLEDEFDDPAELEEEIRITVLHELAHYFGFEEDRISDLGYE